MKLIWHIVRKDLRALRWPLVVWSGLIAAKLAMGVILLTSMSPGDTRLFQTLDGLSKLFAVFECLGVVLVAALVQEDLLVGTTAFWMTRPISGGRLLAAKLLALGIIFGVIPVVVTVPWWLACHLTLGTMAMAALETLAVQAVVVILGLTCAVVTDGLGRFFLWLLAFLAAIPLAGVSVALILQRMNAVVPGDLATTRGVVGAGVAVLLIAAVVGHQYLTRRTWRSVGLIAGGIAAVMLIELFWPWSWPLDSQWNRFLARRAEAKWPAGTEPAGLTFRAGHAEIRRLPNVRADRPVQLWVHCDATGVPAGQFLVPAVNRFTLRWPDGENEEGWSWMSYNPDLAARLALEQAAAPAESRQQLYLRFMQTIPGKVAERLVREPATFMLESRFSLVAAGAAEPVAAAPGGRIMTGMVGERIAAVEREGEELSVTFVRSHPALIGDYLAELGSYVLGGGGGMMVASNYLLTDRAGKLLDEGTYVGRQTSRVASVEISWETKTYRAMKASRTSKARLEAIRALDEAILSRVSFRSQGSFTHTLKADPLVVEPGESK